MNFLLGQVSRHFHPPSTSLTINTLGPWRCQLGHIRFRRVDQSLATIFTPMFNPVIIALWRPWLDGEATWTLLRASVTQWSLAVMRPEKEGPGDLRWAGCRFGPWVNDEEVGVGPEDLVVIYVRWKVCLQMYKSVNSVILNKLVGESWLKAGLSKCQNLVEIFPGDAQISKGKSTSPPHLTV